MIVLASRTLILTLNLPGRLSFIDKTKKKVYKRNIFLPKKCLKIYFFKQPPACLFCILLINSNKRINEHKMGLIF